MSVPAEHAPDGGQDSAVIRLDGEIHGTGRYLILQRGDVVVERTRKGCRLTV
jgi:hypothetical protein